MEAPKPKDKPFDKMTMAEQLAFTRKLNEQRSKERAEAKAKLEAEKQKQLAATLPVISEEGNGGAEEEEDDDGTLFKMPMKAKTGGAFPMRKETF